MEKIIDYAAESSVVIKEISGQIWPKLKPISKKKKIPTARENKKKYLNKAREKESETL